MAANECLARIDAVNGDRLSDEEIEIILEQLQNEKRRREAKDGLGSLEDEMFDAAEQLGADAEEAAQIEKRNRLINIVRDAELKQLASDAKAATGDVSVGLEAAMVGVNAPFANSRRSVDAATNGLMRMYLGGLLSDLRKAGLQGKFNSGHLDAEIARELWDLSLKRPTGKATTSNDAKAIAAIVDKYRKAAIERENRAGAYIKYRSGFVTRQTHDAHKMRRAGFDAWRKDVEGVIDWDAMRIPPSSRSQALREIYDGLSTGVRAADFRLDESDVGFAFKGPGNLAKKESAHRVILFKNADGWINYNKRFGRANLREGIQGDLLRSAQATALMDRFGTNPEAMFDKVRGDLQAANVRDHKQVDRLKRQTLDWQFAEISGQVNIAHNHMGANIGRTVRALQSITKLGGAFISSITDLAAVASERRYQGRNLMEMWGDAFRAPFDGLTNKGQERELAEMIGAGIDGALGDFVSRFSAQDDVPGRVSRLMSFFFKINLLGPWTDSVKRGIGMMMSNDLARKAGSDWASLDDVTRRNLGMYGFDAKKWETARQWVVDVDGRKYLVPDAVTSGDTRTARQELDEISNALAAYYADRADLASPTPGARERALIRMGMPPGTPHGEAVRFMMQFKAFPITVTQKVLGRDLYGYGAKTMRDALLRGQGDRLGLVAFMAAGTVLGYFALQAKEIAKGREPRPANVDTFVASMLQGGGLGIYGDFLFGEASRFGNSPLETVAGPTITAASDAIGIAQRFRSGDDQWAALLGWIRSNALPGYNLFYTKTAMDYLFMYQLQEMANPGYLRRMERNMKRNNDQEMFLPPSEAVPRGGGGRLFEGVR